MTRDRGGANEQATYRFGDGGSGDAGDGAAAQNYLVGFHREDLFTALCLHGDGLFPLKKNAPHGDVSSGRQVQPVPDRTQVDQSGAHPNAIDIV